MVEVLSRYWWVGSRRQLIDCCRFDGDGDDQLSEIGVFGLHCLALLFRGDIVAR